MIKLILIAVANFIAAFVQGATGFGYALIAMSFMPLFLSMSNSSAVSAVTVVAIGVQMTLALRKQLRIKLILLPVIASMPTIFLGLYLLDTCSEKLLRIILACLLMLVTVAFLFLRKHKIKLPNNWMSAVCAGVLTGLSTGLFNIVGPFFLVYYMSVCEDTLQLKVSLEFSFLLAGLYSTIMHIFIYRNITVEVVPDILVSVIAAVGAGVLGLRVYHRLNREKIARVVYILLPTMAVMLVINGFV